MAVFWLMPRGAVCTLTLNSNTANVTRPRPKAGTKRLRQRGSWRKYHDCSSSPAITHRNAACADNRCTINAAFGASVGIQLSPIETVLRPSAAAQNKPSTVRLRAVGISAACRPSANHAMLAASTQ